MLALAQGVPIQIPRSRLAEESRLQQNRWAWSLRRGGCNPLLFRLTVMIVMPVLVAEDELLISRLHSD